MHHLHHQYLLFLEWNHLLHHLHHQFQKFLLLNFLPHLQQSIYLEQVLEFHKNQEPKLLETLHLQDHLKEELHYLLQHLLHLLHHQQEGMEM
jgi:hypothetical protein